MNMLAVGKYVLLTIFLSGCLSLGKKETKLACDGCIEFKAYEKICYDINQCGYLVVDQTTGERVVLAPFDDVNDIASAIDAVPLGIDSDSFKMLDKWLGYEPKYLEDFMIESTSPLDKNDFILLAVPGSVVVVGA